MYGFVCYKLNIVPYDDYLVIGEYVCMLRSTIKSYKFLHGIYVYYVRYSDLAGSYIREACFLM